MDITSLIEVRAPYYALKQLQVVGPGSVRAEVDAEQLCGSELGGMPAAEIGRHLAILGSCACASLAPEQGKCFYLAQDALLTRTHARGDWTASTGGRFVVEAHAIARDKRVASARCFIRTQRGEELAQLDVSYQVLSERLFQRMFSRHRRELRSVPRDGALAREPAPLSLRDNPYRRDLPYTITRVTPYAGAAVLPAVPAALCAGHFPQYPAMPIAFLMYGLISLSGRVLSARLGKDTPFAVTRAEVRADNLAFAGQSLAFESEWRGSDGVHDTFRARALLEDGSSAGELVLTVQRGLHGEMHEPLRSQSSQATSPLAL